MTLSAQLTAVLESRKPTTLAHLTKTKVSELLKHGYYQAFKLHNINLNVFVVYSNFGASNTKRAVETIPYGLGDVIAKELGLDSDFASYHDSGFNPTSFEKANIAKVESDMIRAATHIIHITHNSRVVFKHKANYVIN